jgi:hypothetical protein
MPTNFKPQEIWAQANSEIASSDDERRVIDQTTLMQNLDLLIKEPQTDFGADFARIIKLKTKEEDIDCIINKLFNFNKFIQIYNKLTPAELSNLVPYIRLYKIYPNETDETKKIKEFKFSNFFPLSAKASITGNGSDRGYQANLKNLELNSQGKDTATMYLYDVKIDLIFDSVATLFDESPSVAPYIELFNAQKEQKDKRHNGDPKYYKLLLKFGWNFEDIENTVAQAAGLDVQAIRTFADASRDQLYLNYINHSLNINEDGSVNLSIKYIGSLDAEARNPAAINVLDSLTVAKIKKYQELADKIKEDLKKRYPDVEITEKTDTDTGDVEVSIDRPGFFNINAEDDLKQELQFLLSEKNKLEKNGRDLFLDKIINNISKMLKDTLPYVAYDSQIFNSRKEELKKIRSFQSGQTIVDLKDEIINTTKYTKLQVSNFSNPFQNAIYSNKVISPRDYYEYLFLQEQTNLSTPTYSIRYFPFGVLLKALGLDSSFLIIGTEIKIYNFDTTLSSNPAVNDIIRNQIDKKSIYVFNNIEKKINIFELPVSISVFKQFFHNNITTKNITSMSLNNFLNLCITDLLPNIVQPTNDSYYPKQYLKFKVFYDRLEVDTNNPLYTTSNRLKTKIGLYSDTDTAAFPLSFINPEKPSGKKEQKNVIIFYSVPSFFTRKKDLTKDLNSGIPHFHYGEKNSVINKITFKESTIPYLKESNIQSQVDGKAWKPGVFLRGLYNVTLECMGVVNFRPGTIFYVSPTFTGIKDVSQPIKYGIGGYYMVVSIKLNVESGKYITTVEGRWIATGNGGHENLINENIAVVKIENATYTVLFDPTQQQVTAADSIQSEGTFSN